MKKFLLQILKFGLSAALLAYLGYSAWQDQSFAKLAENPKDWTLLAGAWFACLVSVLLTMLRWHLLLRTLNLPFRVWDTLRVGLISYLVNLFAFGVVGGDALKVVSLSRRQAGRTTEAVASVVVDRILGLYTLLCLAAVGALVLDFDQLAFRSEADRHLIQRLCLAAQFAAVGGAAAIGLMLLPGFTTWAVWDLLDRLPVVGPVLEKAVLAMRMYRRRLDRLAMALGMSVLIHSSYVLMAYLLGKGLHMTVPDLVSHLVIVPISMVAGALPIGAFEVALDVLYRAVTPEGAAERQGFIMALGYRVFQIAIAGLGVVFYLASRQEVTELLHEAERAEEDRSAGPEAPIVSTRSNGQAAG